MPPKTPRFVTPSAAAPASTDSPTPRPRARFTAPPAAPPPSSVQRRQAPTFVRTPVCTARAPKLEDEQADDGSDLIDDDDSHPKPTFYPAIAHRPPTPGPVARPTFKIPSGNVDMIASDCEDSPAAVKSIFRTPAPSIFATQELDVINDEETQDSSPLAKRRRLSLTPTNSDDDEPPEFPSPSHPKFLVPTALPTAGRENTLLSALRREPRVVQHLMPVDLSPTKRRDKKYLQGGMAERVAGWVMEAREMRGGRETVVEVLEARGGVLRGVDGVRWVLVGAEEVKVGRKVKIRWPWWDSVGLRVAVFWGFVEERDENNVG